jgi:hypothetical protein
MTDIADIGLFHRSTLVTTLYLITLLSMVKQAWRKAMSPRQHRQTPLSPRSMSPVRPTMRNPRPFCRKKSWHPSTILNCLVISTTRRANNLGCFTASSPSWAYAIPRLPPSLSLASSNTRRNLPMKLRWCKLLPMLDSCSVEGTETS